MKVLSVASECVPLVKTGGLADVVGALPSAVAEFGVDMRVLLPGYSAVMGALDQPNPVLDVPELYGGPARVLAADVAGLSLLVLEAPHLFERPGTPYLDANKNDWPDNAERFAALSWVAARIAQDGVAGWRPNVVHAHDWQAGLAPYYLRFAAPEVATVLTIHNMAFQGLAPASKLAALQIDPEDFSRDGVEYWGQISALKAGLLWAHKITTVSPTYARELTRPEFGAGLDGVIRQRATDLVGILNGIDTVVWDPKTDAALGSRYSTPRGKAKARKALRRELGLPDATGPLCVVVSRLSEQKGLDVLLDALPGLLEQGGQLALLGSGDTALEDGFRAAASDPNVSVTIGYDEDLAHRMIAGGDAILVPSRFEPCGLTQLYALRYGTVPVVALTGGLADTVIPASPATMAAHAATGLHIHPLSADALRLAFKDLADLFATPALWTEMQKNGMAQPVDWSHSAAQYAKLYAEIAPTS